MDLIFQTSALRADKGRLMLSLIDGAYDIIELYQPKPEEKYNIEWRKQWLEAAKKLGAKPSW